MTQNKQHEKEKLNPIDLTEEGMEDPSIGSVHLSSDQDFKKLQEAYQCADYQNCLPLLEELEKRFPGHATLRKYREEIEIRKTVKSMAKTNVQIEKRKRKTKRLRLGLFALTSTMLVFVVFVYSYFYFHIQVSAKQIEEESTLLMELDAQADHLLLVGKPRNAAEVLDQIRIIDSDYEALDDLEARTYELLLLDEKYQQAVALLDQGQTEQALSLFIEIENQWPGLWDVRQQINHLEN